MTVDIAIHVGHDAGACFFNHDTKEFKIIETDKVLQQKWWRADASGTGAVPFAGVGGGDTNNFLERERFFIETIRDKAIESGIDLSNVGTVVRGCVKSVEKIIPYLDNRPANYWNAGDEQVMCKALIQETFNPKKIKVNIGHHRAHVASTWHQSNFDKAYVLSVDGWGNDSNYGNGFWYIDPDESNDPIRVWPDPVDPALRQSFMGIGGSYESSGSSFLNNMVKATDFGGDLPGKIMGASAFGKMSQKHDDIYRSDTHIYDNFHNMDGWDDVFEFMRWYRNGNKPHLLRLKAKLARVNPTWNHGGQISRNSRTTEEEEFNIAWQIQAWFQTKFMKVVLKLLPEIKRLDNNLIITGGTGLNVVNNAILQNMFDINVYVAGNTSDVGLTYGYMMNHLREDKVFNIRDKFDITYAGFEIWDKKDLPKHCSERPHKKVSIKDISRMLVEGETIGFINGCHEVGPRALGNRSILCNPSLPEMKDKINDIKNREKYRPFAPICRYEDATRYFDVDRNTLNPKKYQHMTIAARTKGRFVDMMPAITHVDGSARLQTVTREQNWVLWDILTETSKFTESGQPLVLLNTSFNVRGKPTLNTFKEAFEVFDNSSLNHVIYWDATDGIGVGYDFYKS